MVDEGGLARARLHGEITGRSEALSVSDRLRASWQRSEDYGVSLESIEPVFTGTYEEQSLFSECGSEVLGALHRTWATSRSP